MIPDWVTVYKPHDYHALVSRAHGLDKVRYAAKLERHRMRHAPTSTLWMLYGIVGTAVAILILVNSIRNGDFFDLELLLYDDLLDFLSAVFTGGGLPDGLLRQMAYGRPLRRTSARLRQMGLVSRSGALLSAAALEKMVAQRRRNIGSSKGLHHR